MEVWWLTSVSGLNMYSGAPRRLLKLQGRHSPPSERKEKRLRLRDRDAQIKAMHIITPTATDRNTVYHTLIRADSMLTLFEWTQHPACCCRTVKEFPKICKNMKSIVTRLWLNAQTRCSDSSASDSLSSHRLTGSWRPSSPPFYIIWYEYGDGGLIGQLINNQSRSIYHPR